MSKHYTMSERTINTRYNLHCTTHAHERSAPSSPEAVAKGNDTPADASCLYSDIIKVKDSAPSCMPDVSPGSRKFLSVYPNGHQSSEAIIAGELTAVCKSSTLTAMHESSTLTGKGIPGTLTSVYSTPVLKEGKNDSDDHGEWTTVTRRSHHGSPARENRHKSLERKNPRSLTVKESMSKGWLKPEQEHTVQEAIKQLTEAQ